jgi:hypothetical protein
MLIQPKMNTMQHLSCVPNVMHDDHSQPSGLRMTYASLVKLIQYEAIVT